MPYKRGRTNTTVVESWRLPAITSGWKV